VYLAALLLLGSALPGSSAAEERKLLLATPSYAVSLQDGPMPRLWVESGGALMFRLPVASGLSSNGVDEDLSALQQEPIHKAFNGAEVFEVTAKSSLWDSRRFVWQFFQDHIEFQQFASGDHPVGRSFFFAGNTSAKLYGGRNDENSIIDAYHYFAPVANYSGTFLYPVTDSQSLGVHEDPGERAPAPEQASHLFSPAPLVFSFRRGAHWSSIGIGTRPGQYQFNGLEYSGSHQAGASFWVNYQGKTHGTNFASPIAAIHFGVSPIATLSKYMRWMDASGFSTERRFPNVPWHRLPIFCGWAEGGRDGQTQSNYDTWTEVLEQRGLHAGTIVIDDKWMTNYGTLEIDTQKWPDMKRFVDQQHQRGRHVLLWVPVADREGLAANLTITRNGVPILADVSNPDYETFLRAQIRHLVADIGIDGFKIDWEHTPGNFTDITESRPLYGIEFGRRFHSILYDETHKWKRDALVETQTPNAVFRDSSDMLRLNDVFPGVRDVVSMMRQRAAIAHVAGWKLVDCDNAEATTLAEWWAYMKAQPSIGVPSLYFLSKTRITHETPSPGQWTQLASIWKQYIGR
jgi:Glycosyl hydrolases family 31 TIM-barrel domain